jgi:hypothetical protein
MVPTVNGKAAVVVQDAEPCRRLRYLAAQASLSEGFRQGREGLAKGRTRPATEVFDEIRAAYGLPR